MKGVEAVMARSWAVLTVMLAVLLAAAPALLAQELLAQEVPASAVSEVEATGYLSPVYPRDAYSHLLNDETTGVTYFARSEDVNLNAYDDGQRVDVTGTLVVDERYQEPILQVTGVKPVEDPTPDETATLTFELSVKDDRTSDATFFGTVSGEDPRHVPLTDKDGGASTLGARPYPGFPRDKTVTTGRGAGVVAGSDGAGYRNARSRRERFPAPRRTDQCDRRFRSRASRGSDTLGQRLPRRGPGRQHDA
jgi:hypothetical protein